MISMPSIGLSEICVLAIVAGFALLVGGLVLMFVIRKQRDRRAQVADRPGLDPVTSRMSKLAIWLLLLGLIAVLLLPLAVIAGGVLLITPVRSSQTVHQGSVPEVQVVTMSTPDVVSLPAEPVSAPQPTSETSTESVDAPPSKPPSLSISPDDDLLFVTLPGIAGLTILVGIVILAVIRTRWQNNGAWSREAGESSRWKRSKLLVPRLVRRWKGKDMQQPNQSLGDDNGDGWAKTARLRYALLALAIWFALSIFLVLDVGFAVSVYLQFTAIYAAFWVLVGALLLIGSPWREKLLILGLLVTVLFSVRCVDWNSRKPFLKDFYRVREGMTVEQVEQIMRDYMGGTCQPEHPLGLPAGESAVEADVLAVPDRAVYRHTDEGWGNSDLGEITFEQGRVARTEFLPD
jgi:hypothetical protein